MTTAAALGVGILGSGPVTQAIHLPALARLPERFAVRAVMDANESVARSVAQRVGARATTSMEDLLGDETVDVVAVCSPDRFHAEQVVAACRAGKRAVLCEKPFATSGDEAARIAQVSAETGVPILVGAMHTYDPGWLAFVDAWGPTRGSANHIRCSVVLPPNPRFEDFATEVTDRATPALPDAGSPHVRAALLRGGILGLAIHDLPLVRAFLSSTDDLVVHAVRTLRPFGYLVVFSCGDQVVELHGHISATWSPSWVLQAYAPERVGTVEFTPSYVQAGSASATVSQGRHQVHVAPADDNGYVGEWRHLYDVAHGAAPRYPLSELITDLSFALDLADGAVAGLRRHEAQTQEAPAEARAETVGAR